MGLVVNGCIPLFYNYVGCRPYGLRAMLLVAFPCFVCGRSRRTGNKVQVWSEVDELVCVWVTVLACVFCSMSVSVVPIWCICLIYRSVFISRCCIVGRWYASWNIFSSAFLAEGLGEFSAGMTIVAQTAWLGCRLFCASMLACLCGLVFVECLWMVCCSVIRFLMAVETVAAVYWYDFYD